MALPCSNFDTHRAVCILFETISFSTVQRLSYFKNQTETEPASVSVTFNQHFCSENTFRNRFTDVV